MRGYNIYCATRVLGSSGCKRRHAGTCPAGRATALVVALLCLAAALPAPARAITLRLSLPISPDSPTGLNIREFARQIHARTGGEIKIELLDKGRRYEEHEVVAAVASGAVEIGATSLNQFATDVPLAKAFLQPFLFNFDNLVQAATSPASEIRALVDKEILYWTNARVLWWQPYGSSVILSGRLPASNPTAIAKRVIGAIDDQTGELVRACGGTPYRVSPANVFTGLEKGLIHAAAIDIMNVKERDFWRVSDTITNLRYAPSLFVIVINAKAWQKLTSQQREIFEELAQDAQAYMWARFATIRAEAYAFAVKKGMRIVELSKTDVEAWRACSAPLLEAYIERAGAAGPKLFNAYGKLRTDPCCREAPEEAAADRR
jgi:C4-dicarboxylate-binding protein DctP